jgi:hypothetical protein
MDYRCQKVSITHFVLGAVCGYCVVNFYRRREWVLIFGNIFYVGPFNFESSR